MKASLISVILAVIYGVANASLPVGSTWLNRAWGVSSNPTQTPDHGEDVVTLNMYNGLSASEVRSYQNKGKYVICYTSAGHITPKEMRQFPDVPTLTRVNDEYPGERYWVDITNYNKAMPWIDSKLRTAKALGCDAVEFDNTDCWEYSTCHPKYKKRQDPTLRSAQLRMLYQLSGKAHSYGLDIGLKNGASLVAQDSNLVRAFDFSVVENCNHYCSPFSKFIQSGKAVLSVQNIPYRYPSVGREESTDPTTLACADADMRGFTRLTDFNHSGWKDCK